MSACLNSAADLLRVFPADGVIKIQPGDFESIPDASELSHVNIDPCTHVAGRVYVLARIAGRAADGSPLLDAESVRLASISETRQVASVYDLHLEDLRGMIGSPTSHEELIDILVARYGQTRGLDREAAARAPLMVSHLRLLPKEVEAGDAVFSRPRTA